jgi:hypothetical protein
MLIFKRFLNLRNKNYFLKKSIKNGIDQGRFYLGASNKTLCCLYVGSLHIMRSAYNAFNILKKGRGFAINGRAC